ncbi:hypothetical protein CVU37_01380 [candidate division BRC1 bacterium HGW-BRC1-1]|nr:MAG: hypothetical protein CVU37_01380 [candidate division BRC1 bacterium HGW-BRC1-1]
MGKSVMRIFLVTIVFVAILLPAALFVFQRKLIFMPRGYESSFRRGLPPGAVQLDFSTVDGKQVAFYVPPRGVGSSANNDSSTSTLSARLWVMFAGNASTGLDWLDLVETYPDGNTGFLMVDYPGYGLCEGAPTRDGMIRNSSSAFAALVKILGTTPTALESRMGVIGHSIGAAAALDFSMSHTPRQVVLVSPFTTLLAMARRAVGSPLCYLVRDRFDNPTALARLAALPHPPRVDLVHGNADDIVPFAMGRELADAHPEMIRFHEVKGADHNMILMSAEALLLKAMTEPWAESHD